MNWNRCYGIVEFSFLVVGIILVISLVLDIVEFVIEFNCFIYFSWVECSSNMIFWVSGLYVLLVSGGEVFMVELCVVVEFRGVIIKLCGKLYCLKLIWVKKEGVDLWLKDFYFVRMLVFVGDFEFVVLMLLVVGFGVVLEWRLFSLVFG